ncbi:MAG TPA: glycosyltransferase [Azospirillum sp.]
MTVVFATLNLYLPEVYSGVGTTMHDMAVALAARGLPVAVAAGTLGEARTDEALGYPLHRERSAAAIMERVAALKPRALVWNANDFLPSTPRLAELAPRSLVYLHNAEFRTRGGLAMAHERVRYVANSTFTARQFTTCFGLPAEVLHPLVLPARCRAGAPGPTVLFVNPQVEKGVEIAMRLAEARPAVPFRVQQGWNNEAGVITHYRERAAAAGNVDWRPGGSDMSAVFDGVRLLLVPSVWEESWGRIVSEAQVNGIPVLAARRGGLPEAVGPGGMLVDAQAPLDEWLRALDVLCGDDAAHAALSAAALTHAARPEIDPERTVERLLDLLEAGPPGE